MKKTTIFVVVLGILILGFLFIKERKNGPDTVTQNLQTEVVETTPEKLDQNIVSGDFVSSEGIPGTWINKCASTKEKLIEIQSPQNWEVYKPGDILKIKWLKCNSDNRHVVAIHGYEVLDEGVEGPQTGAVYLGCHDSMNGLVSWVVPEKLNKGDVSCGYLIAKDLDFTSKRYHFFITVATSQEDGVVDVTEVPFIIDVD